MHVILAPIAQAVKYWPLGSVQCIRHHFKAIKRYLWCAKTSHMVAVVVFEVVDPKSCEGLRVVFLKI